MYVLCQILRIWGTFDKLRFHIITYGCTANHADSKRIEAFLRSRGDTISEEADADVIIVNTCTVTKRTELNVIKRLEGLKGRRLIVAGCMPNTQPELLADLNVITPSMLDEIPFEYALDGTIGTVNISNGCVGDCAYCIVKRARGSLVSHDPRKISREVENMVRKGAKEIRLTSQDCSAYGLDIGMRLPALIDEITSIKGDFQIRIGMMNPFTIMDILDGILESFDDPKVFKFLHVPVQSGSNKVLKDMNRDYEVEDFIEIIDEFRKRFKEGTISTDFIIGFPTEEEEDFEDSLKLLSKIKSEKVNITRFSRRPGTEAFRMKDLLERTKKERSRIFTKSYHEIAREMNKRWVGRRLDVLTTEKGKKGGIIARDSSYKCIILKNDLEVGDRYKVRIKEAEMTYLVGELCQ